MEVTRPILESYQRYLYYYRKTNGQPLTFRTQHSRLTPVRRWFRWLVRNNHILHNPASDLDLPRMEKRIPKTILTAEEVEHVMVVPDIERRWVCATARCSKPSTQPACGAGN